MSNPARIVRTVEEIQRAHDALVQIILDEIPFERTAREDDGMRAACDVLCWVLGHDHNTTFAANLQALDLQLQAAGYRQERRAGP